MGPNGRLTITQFEAGAVTVIEPTGAGLYRFNAPGIKNDNSPNVALAEPDALNASAG